MTNFAVTFHITNCDSQLFESIQLMLIGFTCIKQTMNLLSPNTFAQFFVCASINSSLSLLRLSNEMR